jgi:hypothetical protein
MLGCWERLSSAQARPAGPRLRLPAQQARRGIAPRPPVSSSPLPSLHLHPRAPGPREALAQQQQEAEARGEEPAASGRGVDWAQYPEAAAAVVIYHELIMKIKRILLVYL